MDGMWFLPNRQGNEPFICLSVGLCHTLELVLLLDGVRVGRSLGGVDELVGETLGDGLDVVESGFTGLSEHKKKKGKRWVQFSLTLALRRWEKDISGEKVRKKKKSNTHADGDQGDGLVDPSKWGNVDGLTPDGTLGTDTGRVLTWAGVDDGVDEDL
jgi:hypothetical protein